MTTSWPDRLIEAGGRFPPPFPPPPPRPLRPAARGDAPPGIPRQGPPLPLRQLPPRGDRGGSPFGPFVNRAHFAGLLVIIVPMALALVLARTRGASTRSTRRRRWAPTWRDRLREWNSREGDSTNLIPFLVLVMGGAALVSGSRGGAVALLGALVAMTVGSLAHGRSWRGRSAGLALVTGLIVLAGVWIGGDILYRAVERLTEELE